MELETDRSFVELTPDMSPQQGIARLANSDFAIIGTQEGKPLAVVILQDLEIAARTGVKDLGSIEEPPTALINVTADFNEFVKSEAMSTFDNGARGAVICEGDHVVGVLPASAVTDFIVKDRLGRYDTMNVAGMPGDIRLPGPFERSRVIAKCKVCGFHNTLFFYHRTLTCQNLDYGPSHQIG